MADTGHPQTAFEGLQPALIWRHFDRLTQIPRCSGNEEAAAVHVMRWAEAQGYAASRDDVGNVLVRVPARNVASTAAEAPTVILQGHLDMVGEKDSSSPHDFATDPIRVKREGDYLTADGTTLGSDNGIGVATAMALADDPDAIHGPLELLFTIDEERGLTGAARLSGDWLSGSFLLNLDSEEEGALYVGCAGGMDTTITLSTERAPAAPPRSKAYRLQVSGLFGGHSGLDINCGRGNALQIAAHYLAALRGRADFALAAIDGGDKHNAIPREATAVLWLDDAGRAAAEQLLEATRGDLQLRFGRTDAGVAIALEGIDAGETTAAAAATTPMTAPGRDALIDLLVAMPHGVLAMSQDLAGLVETSTNLAVVRTEAQQVTVRQSSRSSVQPALEAVGAQLFALARLAGATPSAHGAYPGWQPNPDSPLLTRAVGVYRRELGEKPEIKAIHAGLECGIIGEKRPGLDMLSFGPQIEWPHSPSERIKISSVAPFYRFLRALAADLAR